VGAVKGILVAAVEGVREVVDAALPGSTKQAP